MLKFLKKYYWIIVSLLIVLVDQVSKKLIVNTVEYEEEVSVIKDFFYLTYWKNTGIAFGFLKDHGSISKIIVAVLTAVMISVAIIALVKKVIVHPVGVLSLAFIVGGGVGNLIDRIVLRYVVDFLGFIFDGWRFAVFNVADIFVTVGTFLFLFYFVFLDKQDKEGVSTEQTNPSSEQIPQVDEAGNIDGN